MYSATVRDKIQMAAFNVRYERYCLLKMPTETAMVRAILDTQDDVYDRLTPEQEKQLEQATRVYSYAHQRFFYARTYRQRARLVEKQCRRIRAELAQLAGKDKRFAINRKGTKNE